MTIRGDFAKLTQLRSSVSALSSSATRAQLSRVVGAEAMAQVQLGFRASRDPYGAPWKALALRAGKPLVDTGRLRNSFNMQADARGFRIGTNFVGAATHQNGATIVPKRGKYLRFRAGRRGRWFTLRQVTIPRRMMLPSGQLGPIWTKAFQGAANRFVSRLLRRP